MAYCCRGNIQVNIRTMVFANVEYINKTREKVFPQGIGYIFIGRHVYESFVTVQWVPGDQASWSYLFSSNANIFLSHENNFNRILLHFGNHTLQEHLLSKAKRLTIYHQKLKVHCKGQLFKHKFKENIYLLIIDFILLSTRKIRQKYQFATKAAYKYYTGR